MKTIKLKYLLTFTVIILLNFISCKKNKSQEPEPNGTIDAPTGTFMFHFHTYLDYNEVDAYNIVYTNNEGRKISLNIAQLYVSEIEFVKSDNSIVNITGKKILKVLETETYIAGTVPVGNYKSIRFKVGLNPATNSLNPTVTSDSIILKRSEMWFGATAQPDGYIFMNVQGTIDTTFDMSATPAQMQPFTYKIGTNANYKQVTMPDKNFSIVENQAEFGHIIIDYSKLFNGVQLNKTSNLSVTTLTANSSPLATIIVNNIPSMFSYE